MFYGFYKWWGNGAHWLGSVRRWVQQKKYNGSKVTWGSDDILHPPMTIRQVEEVSRVAAIAAGNELTKRYIAIILKNEEHNLNAALNIDQSGGNSSQLRWHVDVLRAITKEIEESAQ